MRLFRSCNLKFDDEVLERFCESFLEHFGQDFVNKYLQVSKYQGVFVNIFFRNSTNGAIF